MDPRSKYLQEKLSQFEHYIAFHEARIRPPDRKASFKLYFYDLPPGLELEIFQHFLVDTDMYKEDHGTLTTLLDCLKTYYSTSKIEEADYVVFPANLYYHNVVSSQKIDELIRDARSLAGKRRLIMFSISDFSIKTAKRSTSFEKSLYETMENADQYTPAWATPADLFINFESTIDFLFNDISIFPLIAIDPVEPGSQPKKFLFSFVGEYYKEGWPEGFIRSPANRKVWEKLSEDTSGRSFVASAGQIKDLANPFYDVPQTSTFTLCPRGITSWSFRMFESILCGSIPVILSDSLIKPFSDIIPWDYFTLSFPESSLANIPELLENIQPETIRGLSAHLQKNQHWFTAQGLLRLVTLKLQAAV
jgi:hypothetical protein